MSTKTLPPASASGRTAARGTRPPRTEEGPGLLGPVRALPGSPFTLRHFRAWSARLVLDDGTRFALQPFQASFVADVFAGFPECWDIVPEGNGKSTLIALLALYYAEFQRFASIPVAAASREQAEIIYRQAEGFVLRTPYLHETVHSALQAAKGKRKLEVPRYTCLEGYRRINHFGGGRIQVFAADDRTGDGQIPTLGIIDEPHRQRDLSLYRTWAGKLTKRGGQIVAISTSGEPGSDFEQTREKIRQSAMRVTTKGAFTRYEAPSIVLHEWALATDAQPDDFHAVKAANPFTGISIPILREKYARPTMTMQHWLRFVCNRPTRSTAAAIDEALWRAAATDDVIPVGVRVRVGLDVAFARDTTALVPLWERDDSWLLGPATVLVPPRTGDLSVDEIKRALQAINDRNPILAVVMDMSFAHDIAQWIADEGITVIDRTQSNTFAVQEYEYFMAGLRSGALRHSGDAALTAHAFNAIGRMLPSGDMRFDRPSESRTSDHEQVRRVIDALKAASMVYAIVAAPEVPEAPPGFLTYWQNLAATAAPPETEKPAEPEPLVPCAVMAASRGVMGLCSQPRGHAGAHAP